MSILSFAVIVLLTEESRRRKLFLTSFFNHIEHVMVVYDLSVQCIPQFEGGFEIGNTKRAFNHSVRHLKCVDIHDVINT